MTKHFLCALVLFTSFFCIYAQNKDYNYHYEVVKMDSTFDNNPDLTVETYLNYIKVEKEKKMRQVIGTSKEVMTSFAPMSPLSNLLVDMLFEWGNDYLTGKKMEKADLGLLNFGGIRAPLPQGEITIGNIFLISPFDNTVTFVYVKGSELKKMFTVFSEKRNAPMANVQTVYQNGRLTNYTIGGLPLVNDKVYTIVTINFLALGGDGFLEQINFESTHYLEILLRDVFIDKIRIKTAHNIEIERVKDNRVIVLPTL
ncbi:MAG: 5'-nucleotidase C-terminal domain-containing protein [Bacteroidales bacterium]|jgi:2',3'-cyclic-nucleotide 2'-phosphodiesterase (5'-nucleotidase family)|nr:5'-nucleotidase C-terminal domain-containing protein [Bacteroidales bacterium]